jgi:hypothetical protein
MVSDPANGVMTYDKIEYLTPPPQEAAFPSPNKG